MSLPPAELLPAVPLAPDGAAITLMPIVPRVGVAVVMWPVIGVVNLVRRTIR